MGLSVVRLDSVVREKGKAYLELSGIDFLDHTPVFDIKPYVPYSDSIPLASCGYAQGEKPAVKVAFSEKAEVFCAEYQGKRGRNIRQLIEDMIRNDPRPASQKNGKNNFGMSLWNVNIRWKVQQECFYIESCEELSD
jgi:hypothetical protein